MNYQNSTAHTQYQNIKIAQSRGCEEYTYISKFVDLRSDNTLLISTTNISKILNSPKVNAIVNLSRINDIRYINKFFDGVNAKLKNGDIFIACVETFTVRRQKMFINKVPVIRNIYFALEFIFLRACPKIKGLKKIYFAITKGKGRLLSKAEALGRIVCCGFEIVDHQNINGLTYIVTKKIKEPSFDMKPSYSLLYKMPRIGKNGKVIGVYKFRTMHPYAEYLQDYILKLNGYSEIGKPAHDFRITSWGRFMRRYWLDELPQLINVIKGEMGLVGVRPLSTRFLAEYPQDLKEKRLKYKPGCVPPYVALLKQEVKQYIESEKIYLEDKEKHPFSTDINYLFKAFSNIITNKIKSA
ncbi:sugar transferase [Flavisolibacter ginsengisoli]|jgi:lipopolysaccharide/colanic/teichoic acid biosynthesis glycosyltransferase|uniref:Sugar transferase n=1 Tax=Flavisolibacter ginsengisoli DSM 18119 TaxID=1121884 RepID=A0A1M5B9F2_9BACT|nr:sugar transferase [Flavisolibacter ginsengisoli]SHF39129.1 sugar transferase [Flavisolibacter ginsengisoli DSM 18119]